MSLLMLKQSSSADSRPGVSRALARVRDGLSRNWDWLLILSCAPLLAHKTAFNAPVIVMAVLGAIRLSRAPRAVLAEPAVGFMTGVFLCFLVPMLLALPDAAHFARSAGTALGDLRFWLAGVFIVQTLQRAEARRGLLVGTAVIVGAWCFDALVQFIAGRNLLGFPTEEGRITGVFHPKFRLGAVTAALAPIVFHFIRRHGSRYKLLWLLLPVLLAAVLLQGSRTAWMMLGVALAAYGSYVVFGAAARHRRRSVAIIAAGGILALGLASTTDVFQDRLEKTAGLFGDFEAADAATSYRLSIWSTGLRIFEDHPVNGVGPRGFRYVYEDNSLPINYFTALGETPTHPHSVLLEIGTETGVIGLFGYLLGWVLVARRAAAVPPQARAPAMPWLIASLVAWFPLNVHMALYASYWSTIAWWLLLIAIGVLAGTRPGADQSRPANSS